MKLKKCTSCKKEFPKTKEYFHRKNIKKKLVSGKIAIYPSFFSVCKKCKYKKSEERRIKKRCKEMNCDVSEYQEKWREQYSETRSKNKQAKDKLTPGRYKHYLKFHSSKTLEEYLEYIEKSKIERNKRMKNISLSKKKHFTEQDLKNARRRYQKKQYKNLTNAKVASYLRLSVKEVPKEMLEFKRLTIQLKRELENLKTTNYGS